jgi:hypothetical protein
VRFGALALAAAALLAAVPALAQDRIIAEEPQLARRVPVRPGETEADVNTMTFLLGQGYAIAAVTEHEIVLHKQTRVYFCPIARFRSGAGGPERVLLTSSCNLLREPAQVSPP